MAPEKYNLNLKGRTNNPLGGLPSDKISGKKVDLMYHHIVPLSKLREFWNKIVESGRTENLEFLLQLHDGITEGTYAELLSPVGKIHKDDALQAAELASKIYNGTVSHDPKAKLRPSPWDDFISVYTWIPGNLFIGPKDRCDDPDNNLDKIASHIIGSDREGRYDKIFKAFTEISKYLDDKSDQASAELASNALREVAACIGVQAYNAKNWTWIDGKSGPEFQV
ncbi:hypothetical protein MXD62_04545 [Frankia sp. Mgl5]|uniref:hypothetical protein n=1 Tax=Frankia sp. Mgl5 TaxID=2933793 RepID=UPI0020102369|nr:hypothetical protein [Frankia sp. Mgl5]MCK9926444.1 hypothetical protein [Frankia sp. Mgl5]